MKHLLIIVTAIFTLMALPALAAHHATAKTDASMTMQHSVNINTADANSLAQLDGVGKTRAQAIVAWRKAHGKFKSKKELLKVRGIGEVTLANNRKNITL